VRDTFGESGEPAERKKIRPVRRDIEDAARRALKRK
jgi:hypothetical protein